MKNISFIMLGLLISISSALANPKVYGQGFVDYQGDLPVLHLKGTEYEMGKQYGYLMGDRVAANVENLKSIGEAQEQRVKLLPNSVFTWLRRIVGWVFWLTYPENIKTHINGMVDGAIERNVKLHRYDISFVNAVIDIVGIAKANIGELPKNRQGLSEESFLLKVLGLDRFNHNCDSMAVWGNRTKDGKTFQTRNTDITTGVGIERYPLVIIYKPDGKIPFVTAAFSGMVGIFTGMNAYGLALGQVWAFSKDVALAEPWHISVRKIFTEATTADEALAKFKKLRTTTYGNNFVIADAGGHQDETQTGYAIEMTAKRMAYFTENDPRELELKYEGESFGYPIKNGVYRGDLSLDPTIRSRQLAANGPGGDPRGTGSYTQRYKGQYDKIIAFEEEGRLIGKEEAESISRDTAMRGASLQTAVYANTDRNMWVSYSKIMPDGKVIQAYEQEYINIPFKDYLADLNLINGEIIIKNWLMDHKNLNLKIRNSQAVTDQKFELSTDELTSTGIYPAKGDVVELYDSEKLIDRLAL